MTLPPKEIFKAYDIRGIVGETLTPEYAQAIGHAIGSEALDRDVSTIAIGRDGRLSGPSLGEALARGIQSAGANVIDVGRVATPMLYFAAYECGTQSGVMVTGSHNPPNYNGLKMMLAGETLAGDAIQALRARIETGKLRHGAGSLQTRDIGETYISRIAGDVKLARPMKIVVDAGNGVAGAFAPDLYRRLGCEVRELFCEVDGNFPNHHPDPSVLENLEDLIHALKTTDAEIGLAFDGDGDRLGVVTKDGTVIYPDRQLMLFAADVLSRNPGATVIYDVKSTRNLAPWIERHGGKPLLCRTGHSFIKAKMRETGAALAGEMSGHVFFKERWYGFDDGLYAGARLLEYLSASARHRRRAALAAGRRLDPRAADPVEGRRELRADRRAAEDREVHRRAGHRHGRRTAGRVCRWLRTRALVEHDTGHRASLRSGRRAGAQADPGRLPARDPRRETGRGASVLSDA